MDVTTIILAGLGICAILYFWRVRRSKAPGYMELYVRISRALEFVSSRMKPPYSLKDFYVRVHKGGGFAICGEDPPPEPSDIVIALRELPDSEILLMMPTLPIASNPLARRMAFDHIAMAVVKEYSKKGGRLGKDNPKDFKLDEELLAGNLK